MSPDMSKVGLNSNSKIAKFTKFIDLLQTSWDSHPAPLTLATLVTGSNF